MIRTLAYVVRFIQNSERITGPLSPEELEHALTICVKVTQDHAFGKEFSWAENKPLSKRLLVLAASLDKEGVLRVGGRLINAELPQDTKFPIILPGSCHLTHLLISYYHRKNFHIGQQALQCLIRRRIWIIRLRQAIKSQLTRCLPCLNIRARPQNPLMGNLPSCRVLPSRPFSECGVDYAGPFSIKLTTRRNAPISKGYLCIFVCMATRAAHLEVVSSHNRRISGSSR